MFKILRNLLITFLILIVIILGLPAVTNLQTLIVNYETKGAYDDSERQISPILEREVNESFLVLINQERTEQGVEPLFYNYSLQNYANIRSVEIVKQFSHTRPNGQEAVDLPPELNQINYQAIGENLLYTNYVGVDNSPQVIAEHFFQAWKSSPGHYENMINPIFNQHSLGLAYDPTNEQLFSASIFTSSRDQAIPHGEQGQLEELWTNDLSVWIADKKTELYHYFD